MQTPAVRHGFAALPWAIVNSDQEEPDYRLIAGRPLPMAGILQAAARFVRGQLGSLLRLGGVAGFAGAAANLLALGTLYPSVQRRLTAIEPLTADPQAADQQQLATALVDVLVATTGMLLLVALVSLPVYAVVNGLLIRVLGRAVLGEPTSAAQAWTLTKSRALALLTQTLVIVAVLALCGLPIAVALSMAGQDPILGLGLTFLVAPLCLVAALILLPRMLLAPVCLVLEDLGVAASFVRARQLLRGSAVRVLGVMIAAIVISRLLGSIVGLPFDLLAGADALSTQAVFLTSLGRIAGTAVSLPLLSGAIALIYVDLRVRNEGFTL